MLANGTCMVQTRKYTSVILGIYHADYSDKLGPA